MRSRCAMVAKNLFTMVTSLVSNSVGKNEDMQSSATGRSDSVAPVKARLLDWYGRRARPLPWRDTRDPYAILVSEVMLQQTQVDRVVPRYLRWLDRWPTAERLAAAPAADVIRAWQGLGYNRRAVNLHRAVKHVAAH